MKRVKTPLTIEKIKELKAGDEVYISGTIYTARDAAHLKIVEAIESGKKLPFCLKGNIIYYTGPAPTKPNEIIGSCGPTTSYRMDSFTPILLECGLKGMIGKGNRSKEVKDAIKKYNCIYFAAIGGVAALIKKCIKSSKIIAYEELGTEAVRELIVEDFPVVVAIDNKGNDIYVQK